MPKELDNSITIIDRVVFTTTDEQGKESHEVLPFQEILEKNKGILFIDHRKGDKLRFAPIIKNPEIEQ